MLLLKEGDRGAFGAIYDRYWRELLSYAITFLKLQDTSEDVVHDVFVRLWEVRDKIKVEKSLRSYLFRICHNQLVDVTKRNARSQSCIDEISRYKEPLDESDFASHREKYLRMLEKGIEGLTQQRRTIFLKCKIENKSYVQVGEELGIAPNTVKNHIVQVSRILREYLLKNNICLIISFLCHEQIFFYFLIVLSVPF